MNHERVQVCFRAVTNLSREHAHHLELRTYIARWNNVTRFPIWIAFRSTNPCCECPVCSGNPFVWFPIRFCGMRVWLFRCSVSFVPPWLHPRFPPIGRSVRLGTRSGYLPTHGGSSCWFLFWEGRIAGFETPNRVIGGSFREKPPPLDAPRNPSIATNRCADHPAVPSVNHPSTTCRISREAVSRCSARPYGSRRHRCHPG